MSTIGLMNTTTATLNYTVIKAFKLAAERGADMTRPQMSNERSLTRRKIARKISGDKMIPGLLASPKIST
jgi:hypothetical protein